MFTAIRNCFISTGVLVNRQVVEVVDSVPAIGIEIGAVTLLVEPSTPTSGSKSLEDLR